MTPDLESRLVAVLEDLLAHLRESATHATTVDALLTPQDVAKLLRIDVRSLRRMRHLGEVPEPMEIGKLLRWRRSVITAWLEAR